MVKRTTISGPFHGIMSDTPPTTDPQGFEDVVNMIGWKGRLRSRPGLNLTPLNTPPNLETLLNLTSFQDAEGFLHTVALTDQNPYMLTAGSPLVFNPLTYPSFIKTLTLVIPGSGYAVGDVININQAGAQGGTALVEAVGSGSVTNVAAIVLPGTGYAVNDVLTLIQGQASTATLKVTSVGGGGAITGTSIIDSGVGYTNGIPAQATGGSGTGAYFNIASNGQVLTALQDNPGTGYVINDTLTVVQPGASGCTLSVLSVSSGTITALAILTPGEGYTSAAALSVTGGTGTGATVTITAQGVTTGVITSLLADNPGTGYATASNLTTSGGEGSGATVNITVSSLTSLVGTGLPYAVVKSQNRVYFCNGSVPLCYIDGEASFKIAGDVPGACRFLTVNSGTLLGAYWTEPDPTQPGAITYPQRLRGSDVNNFVEWNTSSLAFTAFVAELSDVPDNITGLTTLGQQTNIYRTNGISLATFTGIAAEPIYIRDNSLAPKGEGCPYPYSLVTYKNIDYFVGNYDVYAFDGANFTPLMDGKCNAVFFADLQSAAGPGQVRGMITPVLDNGFQFLAYLITIPGTNTTWVLNITEGSWTRFVWQEPNGFQVQGYFDLQLVEQVYTS